MQKARNSALIAASVLVVAGIAGGCSSTKAAQERNPAPCPNVLVLNDAARFIDFQGEPTLDNVAWTGEITDVSLTCRYYEDRPITGTIDIDLALGKGPAANAGSRDITYFIAITRTNREVISREEFTVRADFRGDRNTVALREKISEFVIPRASEKTSGTNFEIIIGFDLSREQVIYNRSGKSLKFPDL